MCSLVSHIIGQILAEGFRNRLTRKIYRPKTEEKAWGWRNFVMMSFTFCTSYPTLLEWPNEEDAVGEEREGEKKKALAYMGLVK